MEGVQIPTAYEIDFVGDVPVSDTAKPWCEIREEKRMRPVDPAWGFGIQHAIEKVSILVVHFADGKTTQAELIEAMEAFGAKLERDAIRAENDQQPRRR